MFELRKPKQPTSESYRAGVEAAYKRVGLEPPKPLSETLTRMAALGQLGHAILAAYDFGTQKGYSPEKKHAEAVAGTFAKKSGEQYTPQTVNSLIEAALSVRAHGVVQAHRGKAATS